MDYSPLALTFTRERGISNLIRGSVSHLPFANAKFAAVVSLDVIIHRSAGPPAASIAEFARVTAPGGYVILNVPAYEWLRSPHDEQVQTARRFERAELLNLIDSAELELVHSTHWNSLLMPPIVAARFLKRALRSTASDLTDFRPGTGATICGAVMGVERALLRAMPLPFGVSIFAIARKPA